MKARRIGKLHSRSGIARAVVILAVAVLVMALVILIPIIRKYNRMGENVACAAALDTARRQLIDDYMLNGFKDIDAEYAKGRIGFVMNGWDDLCPGGGTVYIIHSEKTGVGYDVACGMHASDKRLRTRLNSGFVLEQLQEALRLSKLDGEDCPETLTVKLNGKELVCRLTEEEVPFRFGTRLTDGYKGTVAFYAIEGEGEVSAEGCKDGEICYFSFADEESCANWRFDDGWKGDAYQRVSR
ncbi:MAG: hypothetical protein K6G17_08340 [Oscillospiraceae bacterium]|nr:hypothetical protein [Oscillospiraceae bacterium]